MNPINDNMIESNPETSASGVRSGATSRLHRTTSEPLRPGQIAMANDSRFNETFLSEPLTAYALGWGENETLLADLDFAAPQVLVPRRFEYRKALNSEEFANEKEDIRAIGAEFRRVEPDGEIGLGKTLNKGLTLRIDLDQAEALPNWRQMAVARLLRRLLRAELNRAINLLYSSSVSETVSWQGASGEDPDADLLRVIQKSANQSGIHPNRILFGDSAWAARSLSHRAQSTAGGFASATLSPESLAPLLGMEGIHVCRGRYQSSGNNKSGFAENLILLYTAQTNQSPEDPSNIKRFVTPCPDGNLFRVYEQQITGKITDITVEHYSDIVITSSPGICSLVIKSV